MITGSALTTEKQDQRFIDQALAKMPATWAPHIAKNYSKKLRREGRRAANLSVLDTLDAVQGFRIGVASDDDHLRQFSKARADECFRVAARYIDKDQALENMEAVALRYGIEAPAGRNVTETGARLRLLDPDWWRRNVRKTAARNVEAAAIRLGMVSRVAGLYASDEAVKRRTGQRKRNAEILASVIAENDLGQAFTLQELSDLGVSNPAIKRMELMTRISGFDAYAVAKGHAAEFYTLTAPSKYHARHHISGRENPNFNGSTPAHTQRYLCKVWARIRAKLHREGIEIYGFRVAEPHHDATPHWHLLLFFEPQHTERVRAIFKHYALQEDGDEAGAAVHRFKAEAIDRKKGSAVGYIAKYIAKNIDGYEVGEDWEAVAGSDSAIDTARRVDAWASTWGIRQFQQIGGLRVSVWRELRRLDVAAIEDETFKAIAAAADSGAWDRYTAIGAGVGLLKLPAIDVETGEIRLNKYTEIAAPLVIGVEYGQEAIKTRLREWVFKRSGAAVTARSSVNNCTDFDLKADQLIKERMKTDFEAAAKQRPSGQKIDIDHDQAIFLTGEELTIWKQQKNGQRPTVQQPKVWPIWPASARVLQALKTRAHK